MKIRLSPDLIRVRLNMDDVAHWQKEGTIALTIPWMQHLWKFELGFATASEWQTPDKGESMWCVLVPQNLYSEWLNSDATSLRYRVNQISLSIEKDYPCEHRLGEETRNFTRPHETQ